MQLSLLCRKKEASACLLVWKKIDFKSLAIPFRSKHPIPLHFDDRSTVVAVKYQKKRHHEKKGSCSIILIIYYSFIHSFIHIFTYLIYQYTNSNVDVIALLPIRIYHHVGHLYDHVNTLYMYLIVSWVVHTLHHLFHHSTNNTA